MLVSYHHGIAFSTMLARVRLTLGLPRLYMVLDLVAKNTCVLSKFKPALVHHPNNPISSHPWNSTVACLSMYTHAHTHTRT